MNILFHSNQITERGTEVALYDYAKGNQNILNNTSFIACPSDKVFNLDVLKKFEADFRVFLYKNTEELDMIVEENNIDLLYRIVAGNFNEPLDIKIPTFVHCVFSTQNKQGAFYCPISEFLNRWFRTKYPVLPHIVKKFPGNTQTLHKELDIPENATIFGCYGAVDCFNIPFVHQAIREVAEKRKDIYFIFLNIRPFADKHYENIIFLPMNVDLVYKESFINTCDAMIHASPGGETFGLAIAEFSIKNRPIITYTPNFKHSIKELYYFLSQKRGYSYAKAHLDFLGNKAIKYKSKKDLIDIFLSFKSNYLKPINYDCYSERFSEEKVMKIFDKIINQN